MLAEELEKIPHLSVKMEDGMLGLEERGGNGSSEETDRLCRA